jgi:Glycosyl transferase 4-like domain
MASTTHPKIALLAYAYPPENEIGAARPHRFAKYLPEYGFEVQVFSSGEFPGSATPPAIRTPRRAPLWDLALRKYILPAEEGFSWIQPAMQLVLSEARRQKFSAIISTAPPVAVHLAAGRLSKKLGIPWIADFRDPLVDSPVRSGGLLRTLDPMLERWIVRRASGVVVCTNVMHESIRGRYPERRDFFHLLWNGFDPEQLNQPPVPPPDPARRRRLVHLGSLYQARNPNPLLRGVERAIRNCRLPDTAIEVRLIGLIEESFEKEEPETWRFLREKGALAVVPTHQPRPVVQEEFLAADSLLLVDMNPGGIGYALPAKVFEYIPAGRPIVAMTSKGSPTEWVLNSSGMPVAFLYAGAGEEQAEQAIVDWMAIPRRHYEPGERFWNDFDGRRQVGQLAELLRRAVAAR